mmetsp:Transcript_14457/g.23018  ORF Transcript_14457/g.23018 Transcript_14457/m.23018 type:complete len:353 (-) Transcript_14457:66-1124(-)
MKLKRFLLRYEPPGVGLEVEDGEELSVHHKDLPPASEVSTAKEVYTLVDDLIAGESALLTRRRHRPALIQLLGRLYQVDVEPEDDEGGGHGRSSGEEGAGPHASGGGRADGSSQEGHSICLTGLTGKLQVHNGEIGTIIKAKADKEKYEIELTDKHGEKGEMIKVKGQDHLLPVATKGTLAVGIHVAIRGLRNHIELNGCIARVVECHEDSARYEVRALESGQLFRVKKENLVTIDPNAAALANVGAAKENREPNVGTPRKKEGGLLPSTVADATGGGGNIEGDVFEVGALVELAGLKTAQAYNGQQAEVLSVDRVRSRYEIKLGDGSVKTIRSENVRLVQGKSPRSKRKDK